MMASPIQKIKEILANLKNAEELAHSLSDNANIIDDVGLDSLEMLQFMLEIEDQLAITVDFNRLEYEHLHSIEILADFLKTMPAKETSAR